jgi:hypothetical protein
MSGLVGGLAELHKTLWVERTQKYDEEDAQAKALYRRRTGKPMERYTPSSGNLWKVTLIHLTAAPTILIGSYYLEANGSASRMIRKMASSSSPKTRFSVIDLKPKALIYYASSKLCK